MDEVLPKMKKFVLRNFARTWMDSAQKSLHFCFTGHGGRFGIFAVNASFYLFLVPLATYFYPNADEMKLRADAIMDADSKPIDPIPEKGYSSPSKKGPNFVH